MPKWFNKNLLLLSIIMLLAAIHPLCAQVPKEDLALLRTSVTIPVSDNGMHLHPFPFPHTLNPFKITLGSMMWLYQNLISPQLSSSCLYEPTCSSFSVLLLQHYGIIPGMIMTADRLMRCNRLILHDIPSSHINPKTGKIPEKITYYQWYSEKKR